eukprot:1078369-Prymnesium_polylepis.2
MPASRRLSEGPPPLKRALRALTTPGLGALGGVGGGHAGRGASGGSGGGPGSVGSRRKPSVAPLVSDSDTAPRECGLKAASSSVQPKCMIGGESIGNAGSKSSLMSKQIRASARPGATDTQMTSSQAGSSVFSRATVFVTLAMLPWPS